MERSREAKGMDMVSPVVERAFPRERLLLWLRGGHMGSGFGGFVEEDAIVRVLQKKVKTEERGLAIGSMGRRESGEKKKAVFGWSLCSLVGNG